MSLGKVTSHGARLPARYNLVALLFFLNVVVYYIRNNINIAIVAMVSANTQLVTHNGSVYCHNVSGTKANFSSRYSEYGEFDWNQRTQGLILSSFFYGYIVTQLPGGWLAQKFEGKLPIFCALVISAAMSFLTPAVARWNIAAVVVVRAVMGLAQGVIYPAMYLTYTRWLPQEERTILVNIVFAGTDVANILTPVLTAFLCSYVGWEASFYVPGAVTLLFSILWIWRMYNWPEDDSYISASELSYVQKSRNLSSESKLKRRVPWRKLLTSLPVLSLAAAITSRTHVMYMLLTKLPTYMDKILGVPIMQNGAFNSSIYVAGLLCSLVAAFIADFIISRKYLTRTAVRKTFTFMAFTARTICIVMIPTAGCNISSVLALLICGMLLDSLGRSGVAPNLIEVAPEFSGAVTGITNLAYNLPGTYVPSVVSEFLQHEGDLTSWARAIYVMVALSVPGVVLYLIFGSAERQPWSITPDTSLPLQRKTSINGNGKSCQKASWEDSAVTSPLHNNSENEDNL